MSNTPINNEILINLEESFKLESAQEVSQWHPANEGMLELDQRSGDGLDVSLFWVSDENRVIVRVNDLSSGEYFVLHPSNEKAMEAFLHPFAFKRVGELAVAAA